MSSNSCGVIADDPNKFKQNNSGFNGLLLDSAFSLSNSGETLILRNSDLEDIYNVSYTPEIGANGDGNSLQLSNDDWIASSPSVGLTNDSHSSPVSVEKPVSQNLSVAQEESLMKQNIIVDFGKDRKVIAGADVLFKAVAVGLEKEPLKNARYVWSMGDGSKKEGESVLYTYKYPGQYVVFLTVTSGIYSATDRIIVEAMPADVIISQVNFADGFLELYNRSNYELDLSWWILKSGNQTFSFPENTIILSKNKLKFSLQVTGLSLNNQNQIELLYPNNSLAHLYLSDFKEISVKQVVAKPAINSVASYKTNEIKEEKEIVAFDEIQNKQENIALASATNKDNNLSNKWIISLFGIMLLSTVGAVFLGKNDKNDNEEEDLKPEDFKII